MLPFLSKSWFWWSKCLPQKFLVFDPNPKPGIPRDSMIPWQCFLNQPRPHDVLILIIIYIMINYLIYYNILKYILLYIIYRDSLVKSPQSLQRALSQSDYIYPYIYMFIWWASHPWNTSQVWLNIRYQRTKEGGFWPECRVSLGMKPSKVEVFNENCCRNLPFWPILVVN